MSGWFRTGGGIDPRRIHGKVIDLNDDDLICTRPLPAPPFAEGAFVFMDNVVP